MRISDWSSDVCSSDLQEPAPGADRVGGRSHCLSQADGGLPGFAGAHLPRAGGPLLSFMDGRTPSHATQRCAAGGSRALTLPGGAPYIERSEEHTSELQSLMRTSYAVFCLKKKN